MAFTEIEERLRSDDRPFAETFRTGGLRRPRHRGWASRALLGFGAFMVMVGLAASASELFLQGLLVLGAGIAWTVLRRRTAASKGRSARPAQPGDRSGWNASPPEGHRPI